MNPRSLWLWLFIYVNITAGLIMYSTGELVGDLVGAPVFSNSALLIASMLVVASYYFILGPIYRRLVKINIKPILSSERSLAIGPSMGVLITILQIGYMIFNLSTGVNVAGKNNVTSNSLTSIIFVILMIYFLF